MEFACKNLAEYLRKQPIGKDIESKSVDIINSILKLL